MAQTVQEIDSYRLYHFNVDLISEFNIRVCNSCQLTICKSVAFPLVVREGGIDG